MPDSAVIAQLMDFKRRLAAMELAQQREMARRWLNVEQTLEGHMQALAEQIVQRQAQGTVTRNMLYRMDRYKVLLAETRNQLRMYADYAGGLITRNQGAYAQMGIDDAMANLRTQAQAGDIVATFGRLPVGTVESMIGMASDGSPLRTLLAKSLTQDTIEAVTQAIVDNLALGKGPRVLARKMIQEGYDKGLNRALVLARDQSLRAYRTASDAQAEASGLVTEKVRICAKDDRTCLACLAADGEVIPTGEAAYDHVQGRCTFLNRIVGLPPVAFERGPAWFARQSEATQRAMMGDKRYEAWRAGKFEFAQLAQVTHNETWGAGLQVTPLRDLIPGD